MRYTTFVWHLVRQGLHDAVGVRITGGNVSRGDRRARLLVDHIRAERPGLGLDAATTLVRASRPAALRARMAQIPFDESLHSVDRGDVWEGATPPGWGSWSSWTRCTALCSPPTTSRQAPRSPPSERRWVSRAPP
ncbi:hypothetical protein [Tessaracoccus coleopterorum]|uniref:hypothetical protein n=1 Tax=Tessaracoccus coleopterorum TaxID=2714950 RepID=UPI001E55BFB7|nr:hypothetical protein [Tessaracoccus coleopterorum]